MRLFEIVKDEFRQYPNEVIKLPERGTINSAGYDFYCPMDIKLEPNQKVKIFTDIKAKMFDYEVLFLIIRSSIGIKKELTLINGTGIIDSDYYSNETNDGNIIFAIRNDSDSIVEIQKGDRIMQGIFLNYLITSNESEKILLKKRNGGLGSTN